MSVIIQARRVVLLMNIYVTLVLVLVDAKQFFSMTINSSVWFFFFCI
jgi:hypothetical protein